MTNKSLKSFSDVVVECFDCKEFVANWERLTGMRLSDWRPPRNGIEALIDKATGANPTLNEDAAHAFVGFVWDYVWTRLPAECFTFVECDSGECCK